MTLPAYLDNLDDLPEALAEHYIAMADGRFRLDAEGVEDVTGLKSALERERQRRRARADSQHPKLQSQAIGETPAAVVETMADEQAEPGPGSQDHFAESDDDTEVAVETSVLASPEALISRLCEAEAGRAIAAAGGIPELLLPMVRERLAVVSDVEIGVRIDVRDQNGQSRRDAATGAPLSVAQLVAELRADPIYGRAFEGRNRVGSGSPRISADGDGQVISIGDASALGRHVAEIATGRVRVSG